MKPGKRTVTYVKPTNKKMKKIKIAEKVTLSGVDYKVTAIASKAFFKNNKLKKITIPKTVTTIGKKAFYGCKKLKNIVVKTKKLKGKSVGKKAFLGTHKKIVVKVPKKLWKKYKKVLSTRGLSKKATIKN